MRFGGSVDYIRIWKSYLDVKGLIRDDIFEDIDKRNVIEMEKEVIRCVWVK